MKSFGKAFSRSKKKMAGSGKRWVFCLLAVLLASGCAEDQDQNDDESQETTQNLELSRSGAYYASEEDSLAEHLDNSHRLSSNYQQVNQPGYYGPPGPIYGPVPGYNVPNVVPGGYNYQQQANEESLKQHYKYNHHKHSSKSQQGYVADNFITRPIPHNEYYWLHRQPGYQNVISCQREGEIHSFWTPSNECMICVCVKERLFHIEPACVSCGLCSIPPPPVPVPIPVTDKTILPVFITTEVVPQPIPETVSCSPMPSGTPFQNPLNPCQICVCYETINVFGVQDVKIECQANPQCVLPPEPVPYIPDKPLPLPQCEQFPNNVLFPHPVEPCKVCKCTVEYTRYGPQDQIVCFPDADCIPPPVPIIIPEPVIPVTIYPIPPEPIIIPVTEPVWPVTVRPSPGPGPGPLPGPSPHESCRPYQPNQPFTHPWDECQICVCIEGYNVGRITIEVNCYTNSACCIAIPFEQTAHLPYVPTQPGQIPVVPIVPGYVPGGVQPHSGYIPGYGKNYGQNPYLPITYGQGTYGQSTAYDNSEHYDKSLSYDQKAYAQSAYEQSLLYGQGLNYGQTAYGQSTAYDNSEHYDKSLNYDQKAYGQYINGQAPLYGQGLNYGQTAYGQNTAYDNSEHYDKSLNYDQKAYGQYINGQAPLYGQGINYGQTAYGQSTVYDNSEHYDKSLNYDQKAYGQYINGQAPLYGQGLNYGQTAYGQNTAYDNSEHYDKSLNYDQKAYGQYINGQAPLYGQGLNYGQTAYGQSTAYDNSEHYDKSLSYDNKAYAQSANGQTPLYGQGLNYGQAAYGQSTAYDNSEHYDKSLSYDNKAYAQSANGQAPLYGQGLNYGQAAYGQSTAYDNSEHYDKSLSYDNKAYAQSANGQAPLYGQGVNYGQAAYGQSTAYDNSEHYDKSLSYDQKAYAQSANGQAPLYVQGNYGQGANYGLYGQSPAANIQLLGLGTRPVKLSVKARINKSGDPEKNEASDELE